jgi:hypothetical protein
VRPDSHDDEPTTIWVCQGAPRCDLLGDDAIAAQRAGCPWCRRVIIDEFGEHVIEPGTA